MLFIIITALLLVLELLYLKIALRFNISDTPNSRSSHKGVTLRGGGVIFPISALVYFLFFGFHYFGFILGLLAVSAYSFANDIKHQSRTMRMIVQMIAVTIFFWRMNFFEYEWYWLPIALVLSVSMLNAYNFMDGINGITAIYSFTVLASLFILNREMDLFDPNLLICLALGNLVFSFFNFRTKAKCFAGDVGSISMAFCLLFLASWAIIYTGNFIFILFFTLYGVDAGLTIAHRLYKGENIAEAHRQHLYQYLANEMRMPQLLVSTLYALGQIIISLAVLLVWKKEPAIQFTFAAIALLVPTIIYISIKYWILRQLEKMPSGV